jgi:glycerol-3-phosphate dehydrogenase
VRPLYDDGRADLSAVTRDYVLRLDDAAGSAPVLSVYGGKLTTYRRLAERAMAMLAAYFPGMKGAWTAGATLPGSDFGGAGREQLRAAFVARYRALPGAVVKGILRRHGALGAEVLGDARHAADLGEDFGAGLCEREVRYLVKHEWAASAEDVLWRRTKCGLHLDARARARVAEFVGA